MCFCTFYTWTKKAQQLGVLYPGNLVLSMLYRQWNLTNVMRICLYVSLRFIEQTLDVICSPHSVYQVIGSCVWCTGVYPFCVNCLFFTAFFPIVLALHTAAAILTVINTIAREGPTRNDCCLKVNIKDKTVQSDWKSIQQKMIHKHLF